MAIEQDNEYALAYWQRACAKAKLEHYDDAVEDIKTAIELSESLSDEIESETYFENLKDNKKFKALLKELA
jgi:F0F1-type ATP synthase delta subunit